MTEKDKEIEKLKEEKCRYEDAVEKFRRDLHIFDEKAKKLESDVEDKDCQIEEMKHRINCLESELAEAHCNKFELSPEPIKVAEMLIYAKYSYKNRFTGMQHRGGLYSKSDLRQIAKHLLVYCDSEGEE